LCSSGFSKATYHKQVATILDPRFFGEAEAHRLQRPAIKLVGKDEEDEEVLGCMTEWWPTELSKTCSWHIIKQEGRGVLLALHELSGW
jgi:hypothetical protein